MNHWRCSRRNCAQPAGWFAIIRLWPEDWPDREPERSLPMLFPLPFCGPCSTVLQVSDLLTDDGFNRVSRHITMLGYSRPSRSSAKLEIHSLQEWERFAHATGLKLPAPLPMPPPSPGDSAG